MLDEVAFSNEVTFTKGVGGISTADGTFVSDAAAERGLGRISGGRMYGYQVCGSSPASCYSLSMASKAKAVMHVSACAPPRVRPEA